MTDILRWIRGHKASTAGLVLVIAGCLALVMLARRVHHLKLTPSATAVATVGGASVASGSAAALAPSTQAGTERATRSSKMRSEFEAAASDRDFIQQAMSRPQEGGKFYALLAWKRCNLLRQDTGVEPTPTGSEAFHDGALARVQALTKRCAGVQETWPDIRALYTVAVEKRGGRDFLMPAGGRGIVAPAARETADADIDAALRTGDRWAAAEALRDNASFLDVGNSTGDDGVDRQLRGWAAGIVACELVGDCRGGVEVALHCVATGDCAHDDWRDVILAQVPDTHRMIFDTMLAGLHQRTGQVAGRTDADLPAP
jgi:hypothetical protein